MNSTINVPITDMMMPAGWIGAPSGGLLNSRAMNPPTKDPTRVDDSRRLKHPLRVTCAPTFAARWLVPRLATYQTLPGASAIAMDASQGLSPPGFFDVAIRCCGRRNQPTHILSAGRNRSLESPRAPVTPEHRGRRVLAFVPRFSTASSDWWLCGRCTKRCSAHRTTHSPSP
jgi:hypothetical protein